MDTQPCPPEQNPAPQGEAAEAPNERLGLISDAIDNRPAPVKAHTYLQSWETQSKPVALICDGGGKNVVKALQNNRPEMKRLMINEQIVARLGELMHAPVPRAVHIDVPAELIAAEPKMAQIIPGVAHGLQFVEDVTERMAIDHTGVPENRPRFARLAILYGWVGAADHQFVYGKAGPYLVYSVDHGNFFPDGMNWTQASLQGAPNAQPDATLTVACNLTKQELDEAISELSTIDDHRVSTAVALPPDTWGLSMDERLALLEFLIRRRDEFLATLPAQEQDGAI
jgi:hypothetical protein